MKLFRNIFVFSLFIYSFALPSFAQETIDLELSKLMEAENVGESNIRTIELHVIPMSNSDDLAFLTDFLHNINMYGIRPYDYVKDANNSRVTAF